jgi:hypothetical protein
MEASPLKQKASFIIMPLTKKEMQIKSNFIREYGRRRGTNIFYAWENKHLAKNTLSLSLPRTQALKFYHHLKKEHPVYSRGLKLR